VAAIKQQFWLTSHPKACATDGSLVAHANLHFQLAANHILIPASGIAMLI